MTFICSPYNTINNNFIPDEKYLPNAYVLIGNLKCKNNGEITDKYITCNNGIRKYVREIILELMV